MKRTLLLITALIILITGCIKKNDFNFSHIQYTNWKPDWAFPFISSTLTLRNMLNSNTIISTDSTSGLMSLHYTGKGFSFKAADFINIPDQVVPPFTFALSTPITSLPSGVVVSDSTAGSYNYTDPNGSQLQHIMLKAGTFHIDLGSTYNQNISLKITFPNIKNGGIPLQTIINITYPSTTGSADVDMTGYLIDMTNGGSARNYMAYNISYSLTGTGQPIDVASNMSASLFFKNLKFSFIDGSIGHFIMPLPYDTINVGILNRSVTANVRLLNPKMHLSFVSSFGMTVAAKFDSLYGFANNGTIDTVIVPPMNIQGDTLLNEPSALSAYTIDSTNSTIRNIFSPVPNYIIYNAQVDLNPIPTTAYNFITDTSSITISIDAELPACFQIIKLALQDTVKMLMPPDTTLLTYANFAVQVTNSFPVYASIQVYFADTNYVILDSLVTPANNLIGPAIVDATGKVKDSTVQLTNFTLLRTRYTAMASKIRHGIIRGNLLTSGNGAIQLLATDHLSVKTAFRFSLDYSL